MLTPEPLLPRAAALADRMRTIRTDLALLHTPAHRARYSVEEYAKTLLALTEEAIVIAQAVVTLLYEVASEETTP